MTLTAVGQTIQQERVVTGWSMWDAGGVQVAWAPTLPGLTPTGMCVGGEGRGNGRLMGVRNGGLRLEAYHGVVVRVIDVIGGGIASYFTALHPGIGNVQSHTCSKTTSANLLLSIC